MRLELTKRTLALIDCLATDAKLWYLASLACWTVIVGIPTSASFLHLRFSFYPVFSSSTLFQVYLSDTLLVMDTLVAQYSRPAFENEGYSQEEQQELSEATPPLSLKFALPPIARVSSLAPLGGRQDCFKYLQAEQQLTL